jgi:hypothetical protein
MTPLSFDLSGPGGLRPLDWRAWLLATLFALVSFGLDTHSNRFPSTYHPDEPSKARQVLNGEYNFHHPMLMLTATEAWIRLSGTPAEAEAVTVAGRTVSAFFTSGAVFFLVLLAAIVAGPLAAAAAGALLVANHELFELAHYFKEDPALLFGIGALFLALAAFDRSPTPWRAAAMGAALGLAISGKYLGAVALPVVAILLWRNRARLGLHRSGWPALAGLVVVLVSANLPILLHPELFADGFTREVDFVVIGHKGITRSVPHGVYWKIFLDAVMPVRWLPVVGALLIFQYVTLWLRRRTVSTAEWALAIFPLAFAVLLSFSPKTNHRYFLPDSALLLTLAALGIANLRHLRRGGAPLFPRFPNALPCAALAAALAIQAPTFLAYYHGFSHEGRAAMVDYLRAHVPAGTTIVQDKRVDLDALGAPYDFQGKLFAADVGTIAELRARGIRYVAVAEGDYGRFFREQLKPTAAGAGEFYRRKAFYDQLFGEGTLLFDCAPGQLQYLQPHLMLYELPPAR